ncbi:MAG: ABC transporter ATP-binding protein [Firmicutes bacterium]|nr:ABC transporter ATP-binding protein [Bacillota bacterium]
METNKIKRGYLTRQEEKEIAKENKQQIKRLEKEKKRKKTLDEYTSVMRDENNLVEFDNLNTNFFTERGVVKAVNGVNFSVKKGATVGIVGESGCGKSVTAMSLMRLIQGPMGQITDGAIRYNSRDGTVYDMAKMPIKEVYKIRGKEISMIFQEPMTSLNPVVRIGNQLDEVSKIHLKSICPKTGNEIPMTKEDAKARSIDMLAKVGIPAPEHVYKRFPHELSGGMRQRVMISMALLCDPSLIIADEPTTALDVTVQAQILELLKVIREQFNGSIMLITHDLGVIAEMADYVIIMYAGRIIEEGTVDELFYNPQHPYTVALHKSKPTISSEGNRLFNIPGNVPNPINMPTHCFFRGRCSHKCERGEAYPELVQISETHKVACFRAQDEIERKKNEPVIDIVANNTETTATVDGEKPKKKAPAKKTATKKATKTSE